MPKLSVYVPDDLWDRVREEHPDANVSQVVQRGLGSLLADTPATARSAYLKRPRGVEERIEAAKTRLAADAKREYQQGYAAGLDVGDELTLHELNELASLNFDVARWLGRYGEAVRWNVNELAHWPPDVLPETAMAVLSGAAPPSAIPGEPLDATWPWLKTAGEALGSLANPIGFDQWNFTPTTPRVRGFRDALRDIWKAIEQPDAREPATSDADKRR